MANLSADFQAQLQQYRELVKETTQNAHAALTAKQKVADDLEIVEEQLREKEARVRELQRENEFLSKSLQQKEAKKTKPSKMEMLSLKVANESMMEEIKMLSESLLETGNAGRNERTRNHLVAQLQSLQDELQEKERKLSMLSASFEESLSKEARKLAESFDEGASMTSFRFSQPSPSPSFQATAVTATAASPYTPVPYTAQNIAAVSDAHLKTLTDQLRQKDTQLAALAAANDALTMANAVLTKDGGSGRDPHDEKMQLRMSNDEMIKALKGIHVGLVPAGGGAGG